MRMAKSYRALISVPVTADDDDTAWSQAVEQAHSLIQPGSKIVAGHLELVGEVREGTMQIARVVTADPLFLRQLPPDWKP